MKISLRTSLLTLPVVLALAGCASLENLERPDQWNSFKEKKATALFKELCATQAREQVYSQVQNVQGFLWISAWETVSEPLTPASIQQLRDPYLKAAADFCDTCLIKSMLLGPTSNYPTVELQLPNGETIQINRTANRNQRPVYATVPMTSSQYVVSFEDITTPVMQQLWIGGSRLLIRDRSTGALLGERTSFARGDALLQSSRYPTGPWAHTLRCPEDNQYSSSFIQKVLKPIGLKK